MPVRCSVFIATSLDGFIARADGGIDWLNEANARVPPGEDCGYHAFTATIDAMVIGRRTFEQVLGFGGWVYGPTRVVVLSRTLTELPRTLPETVTLSRDRPRDVVDQLSAEGKSHLYIDGGLTIQAFLADGLIDDLTITLIPILLGSGAPLFGPLASDVRLELVASRSYPFGFVQNQYRVLRDG
jgi:dihydrofolate reductase